MADVTVTASSVLPSSSTSNVYEIRYNAGATITAGQSVYLDTSNVWQLADCNASSTTAGSQGKVGISVNDARANCPLTVQTQGDVNIGGTLTAGKTYVVSATAGGIAPISDNVAGWYTTILGIATSASNLRMPPGGPWVTGTAT